MPNVCGKPEPIEAGKRHPIARKRLIADEWKSGSYPKRFEPLPKIQYSD
jgi:hypothetical protein